LVDEEIVFKEEEDMPTDLELKWLKYQEREWECEDQLRIKEIELREREH